MNPGPVEEAGTTARSVVSALSSQPVVLALVVFNVLYLGGTIYAQIKTGETYDRAAERWKNLTETAMRYCNVEPRPQGMKLQSDESHPAELPPPEK